MALVLDCFNVHWQSRKFNNFIHLLLLGCFSQCWLFVMRDAPWQAPPLKRFFSILSSTKLNTRDEIHQSSQNKHTQTKHIYCLHSGNLLRQGVTWAAGITMTGKKYLSRLQMHPVVFNILPFLYSHWKKCYMIGYAKSITPLPPPKNPPTLTLLLDTDTFSIRFCQLDSVLVWENDAKF